MIHRSHEHITFIEKETTVWIYACVAPIATPILHMWVQTMKPRHARISQVSWRELKITTATMRRGNFRTSLTRVTLPRSNPSASPHDVFDIYKFDRIWEKPELKTYEILRPQKILTLIRNWKTISKTDHVCNLMTAKTPWCRPNSLSICKIQLWIYCLIIS